MMFLSNIEIFSKVSQGNDFFRISIMAKTRKSGARKGTRKISKWTAFVKKIYVEMKKKDKNVKLGDAMKEASKRKGEM